VPKLSGLIASGRIIASHRPWPRVVVTDDLWLTLKAQLASGRADLLGLWAETAAVHMAVLDNGTNELAVVTKECPDGRFLSIGAEHPPAIRPERAVRDLFGLEPVGLPDSRPWLDHGQWDIRHPLAKHPKPRGGPETYAFLPAEGESLHEIPVGPVHAGIIEPGHFRFTANGEAVVRLEERLGYTHKGIESLMCGASVEEAARLAGRTSGDSTAAYAFAFSRAVEAALGIEVPLRAVWLRALMAEFERLANHLGDIGAICNDAAFALMQAYCGVLRERVLRTAAACFGHRLMMDRIVPGGVSIDLSSDAYQQIRALIGAISKAFPALVGFTTTPRPCRTARSGQGSSRRPLRSNMPVAAISAGRPGAPLTPAFTSPMPLMTPFFTITTFPC
jgi:hypothetical protein